MPRKIRPAGQATDGRSRTSEKSPVLKALRLLDNLAHSREQVSLAEMSRKLVLPKSTSHRLAAMLERDGLIDKDPVTLRYSLGARFEDMALSALRNGATASLRRRLMAELAERLGVRINFAVLKSGNMLLVEWVDSVALIRIDLKAGTQIPAHCSAGGKLLLAFAPDLVRTQFLKLAPFKALTAATITSARALAREIALIRRQGYAEDRQEFLPGVSCLAVPVRNRKGEVVAGLALMAPEILLPLREARRHRADLQACADAISAAYGWPPARAAEATRRRSAGVEIRRRRRPGKANSRPAPPDRRSTINSGRTSP
ncbi:MAG TPA: IclR family transcriptional regulator [Xanthobacteraceae bacterium]|jgi:DNA-binding IclR family transcriptional regulator